MDTGTQQLINDYAKDVTENVMSAEDRESFRLDSAAWQEGLGLHQLDNDGTVFVDEHWEDVRDAIMEMLGGPLAKCLYCGTLAEDDHTYIDPNGYIAEGVPGPDNDDAWVELAKKHSPECEWIRTRAHQLDD